MKIPDPRKFYYKKVIPALIAAALANAWLIFSYSVVNDTITDTSFSVHPFISPIDELIPYWPNPLLASMYILHPWVLVVRIMQMFWKNQHHNALRAAGAVAMCYMISIPIFSLVPTCIPRDELDGGFLMHSIWESDAPCSAFPSLHASTATVGLISGGFFYTGFFATVILSVVPLRQHVVADVAAGVIIGTLSSYAAGFLARKLLRMRGSIQSRSVHGVRNPYPVVSSSTYDEPHIH